MNTLWVQPQDTQDFDTLRNRSQEYAYVHFERRHMIQQVHTPS